MCAIPQLVSDPFNPSRNKKNKRATILRYFPPLLFLPPWFFLLFVCFSFASVIFELNYRAQKNPAFWPSAFSLKNAMAAKCAIYGSFVKDRRDILRHSSTYQLNARYDSENN